MGKLEDLRVERVDGVDRPATGHRWVIVKSEDAPESVEKDTAGVARTALEALAKEEGISVSKETAEALTALAELLELDIAFKSVDGAADEDTNDEPAATETDDDAPITRGEFKTLLKGSLEELFASDDEDEDDADVEKDEDEDEEEPVEKKKPVAKSRQADDNGGEIGTPLKRVRKTDRPSFANVICGQ